MWRFNVKGVGYGTGIGMMVLVTFLLGGCDFFDTLADIFRFGNNHAQAQQDFRIETFTISPGSFLILADTPPSFDVRDGTTIYTQFVDNTTLTFTTGSGSEQTISLDPEDTVIERPGLNMLTVIRAL